MNALALFAFRIQIAVAAAASSLITEIGNAVTSIIGWAGNVVTAVVGESGQLNALLPVFALGIGVSVVMLGVKVIRSFTWGA